jgi:hypothetical protein
VCSMMPGNFAASERAVMILHLLLQETGAGRTEYIPTCYMACQTNFGHRKSSERFMKLGHLID